MADTSLTPTPRDYSEVRLFFIALFRILRTINGVYPALDSGIEAGIGAVTTVLVPFHPTQNRGDDRVFVLCGARSARRM